MAQAVEHRDPGADPLRIGELRLEPLPSSVPQARRWFDRLAEGLDWVGGRDECRLLLCELVTNAIVYACVRGPWCVRVVWWRSGSALRVEVHDPDAASPALMRRARAEETGGRGLYLVDAFADDWGVAYPEGAGKCVWFRLDQVFAGLVGGDGR
ncbi:ATP-binding protein [Peterkaempfera bronchialis]|uniref:ATP-binding protein n=1 Tax=Peterkaempfera bronchialis TaxID=2126346 RepID=UPI003C30E141